jgi:hypothetical protein
MELGANGQATADHPSCALTTKNRNGGNKPGTNGIRHCGAASQSTMGWGGEPGRAIDGKKCTTYGDGSCTHTDAGEGAPMLSGGVCRGAWARVTIDQCRHLALRTG